MSKEPKYCNTCTHYWCCGRDIGYHLKNHVHPAMNTPSDFNCKDYSDYVKTERYFKKVLHTLKNNKVMVKKGSDGIYIRLADPDKDKGVSTTTWSKVISYNE